MLNYSSFNIKVLIPCRNEEKTISAVISDFKSKLPNSEIIVFDNCSEDNSVNICKQHDVQVVFVAELGKGAVVRKMFNTILCDAAIIVDGDSTYSALDVEKLLDPVLNKQCDMAVGMRNVSDKLAMPDLNKFGNKFFSTFISFLFRKKIYDVLSGYRVVSGDFMKNVQVLSDEFEVEVEITLKALHYGFSVEEVPVRYFPRPLGSRSKLKPFKDGIVVLNTIISLFRDFKPLTFFGIFALFFFFVGSLCFYNYFNSQNKIFIYLVLLFNIISFIILVCGFVVHTIDRRFRELRFLSKNK